MEAIKITAGFAALIFSLTYVETNSIDKALVYCIILTVVFFLLLREYESGRLQDLFNAEASKPVSGVETATDPQKIKVETATAAEEEKNKVDHAVGPKRRVSTGVSSAEPVKKKKGIETSTENDHKQKSVDHAVGPTHKKTKGIGGSSSDSPKAVDHGLDAKRRIHHGIGP